MAMDLRHVDHPRFYTWAAPCCFKSPVRRQGERLVTRFALADEFEEDLCSDDPWLILHKIDSPTKMRYVGARVANCSSSGGDGSPAAEREPELQGLAASIEAFLPPAKQQLLAEARAAGKLPPARAKKDSKADAAQAAAAASDAAARKEGQQATGTQQLQTLQQGGGNGAGAQQQQGQQQIDQQPGATASGAAVQQQQAAVAGQAAATA